VILSDRSINEAIASGRLEIDPFDPALVQPASVDVRLDSKFLVFRNTKRAFIDVKQPADDLMEMIEFAPNEPMFLHPHEFVLGSTVERVKMPDDLVARLEGRSSLGRLGVVIHSSLPYDAPVLFLDDRGVLDFHPIGELVEHRRPGRVVGFDPDTFEVGFHEVSNWFRELPDRIYEVRMASGRRVHVTAGHNLFTVDSAGELVKTPTRALGPGTRVAVPRWIPDPGDAVPEYRLLELLPEDVLDELLCQGPTVDLLLQTREPDARRHLRSAGLSASYYLGARTLPLPILRELCTAPLCLDPADRLSYRGSGSTLAAVIRVDRELAWLLGLYVAEGYRRYKQVNIANTDPAILDRAEAVLKALGQRVYRNSAGVTCCSVLVSALFEALGMGEGAPSKRLPSGALGWPWRLLESLLGGLIDGEGTIRPERECLWTTSADLVSETLVLSARLGKRAVTQVRPARPRCLPGHVVSIATNRHKVLTSVNNPYEELSHIRLNLGLSQLQASRDCGFHYPTSLNNVEKDRNRGAVHVGTLERLHDSYARRVLSSSALSGAVTLPRSIAPAQPSAPDVPLQRSGPSAQPSSREAVLQRSGCSAQRSARGAEDPFYRLTRLVNGDLLWDEVVEVVDTGRFETVYDLEVRPHGAHIENFLAGYGGVFVSNTAGFVDPSFNGHITLEISNLANLPIALYPGMRIGQLSFSRMTTAADRPYGPARGSKYSGQNIPTASRLYLDFK
jgi:deoxycytidine triphosphate deaminase